MPIKQYLVHTSYGVCQRAAADGHSLTAQLPAAVQQCTHDAHSRRTSASQQSSASVVSAGLYEQLPARCFNKTPTTL